ncbi:MAG: glycosyltransferase family 4 protein [Verrucomicrobiales bacterium]|jgi:glycosyltransferase involved in cell wall biosynthesis|nr:glycosyltransferase family 4 protein [Verrucomicrobiales bacterium]HQZ28583.1 glycosyltransferase family 4 protein [Verrucomicrobiales bacterium]
MAEVAKSKIVIVHYHLRRGGVLRVIEATCEVLAARGDEVLILSGEPPVRDGLKAEVRVVPSLNYRKTGSPVVAESLAEQLKKEALAFFGDSPDLWHFHNPTLAKNVLFPSLIRELASQGERIVLQLHDFSEDGRPGNYSSQRSFFDTESSFEETLYPIAKQIHYATINQRDHDFLKAAGVPARNLHVLPNAVPDLAVTTTPEERPFSKGKLFALYPSRGIRRKNIGELLLLALIFGDRIDFATSLSPENPDWQQTHQEWAALVSELHLPVTLGIADGVDYSFLDLLGWSDFIVTTSIGEGFGLAFLEPWIIGKPVMGRDLPDITRDFSANGIEMNNLYHRIDLPVEWLDEMALIDAIESMLRRSYLAYNCELPRGAVKQTLKAWVKKGRIDFGVLSEPFQMQVLRKLRADPSLLDHLSIPRLDLYTDKEISARREIIREVYSLANYGEKIEKLYSRVCGSSVGKVKHLATRKVLAQFLCPSRLNLLRN